MEKKINRPASQANDVNLDDLPDELRTQLRGCRTTGVAKFLYQWANDHGESFTIDDALIALFQSKNKIIKRSAFSSHLYRMVSNGQLEKIDNGIFKIKK